MSVCFLFLTVSLTLYSLLQSHSLQGHHDTAANSQKSGLKTLLSFRAPTSLFPPSAVISLTDDNTTFFLARPAMYGPALPTDGLSGQLWVGSGFSDDTIVRGGMVVSAVGELGCSDIPGWVEGHAQYFAEPKDSASKPMVKSSIPSADRSADADAYDGKQETVKADTVPVQDDGTDDHLHHPLRGVPLLKSKKDPKSENAPEPADIQSLQESAEITGKVVLLSRGGCGFLEKTKCVQRRGGKALIVGDYTRGDPLINMYAHGDTSNISIPSIFTAHTSAHLLSSLVPPEGSTENLAKEGEIKTQGDTGKKSGDKPTFTPVAPLPKSTSLTSQGSTLPPDQAPPKESSSKDEQAGWLSQFIPKIGLNRRNDQSLPTESRRPPSSGRIAWIQSDDWDDDPKNGNFDERKSFMNELSKDSNTEATRQEAKDNFVIGVHDWRDPDIVGQVNEGTATTTLATFTTTSTTVVPHATTSKALSGGSRTPGSGIYGTIKESPKADKLRKFAQAHRSKSDKFTSPEAEKSWFASLFFKGEDPAKKQAQDSKKAADVYKKKIAPHFVQDQEFKDDDPTKQPEHQGLWVTMTPTAVSTSPFFDTLLVLVVSPLVTLTVVYALLLLRSRIRRRRWRAPRSVVDRLPVRTYHTMSYSSSTTSSETSSLRDASDTSPLLSNKSRRIRPRSRTLSEIQHDMARNGATASLERATAKLSSSHVEKEKGNAFKRKYSRKQIECVVCLEEYIDGQSRVMSLPCGHEFHAECM